MQLSGATLKGLNRYGTDYASTKYNEAFNRRQVGLDNLYRLIAGGQAAAAGQAAQGGQMGNQVSSAINTQGQSMAGMYQDFGNINAAEAMSGWNTTSRCWESRSYWRRSLPRRPSMIDPRIPRTDCKSHRWTTWGDGQELCDCQTECAEITDGA